LADSVAIYYDSVAYFLHQREHRVQRPCPLDTWPKLRPPKRKKQKCFLRFGGRSFGHVSKGQGRRRCKWLPVTRCSLCLKKCT